MKVLVCGGRDYWDKEKLFSVLDEIKPTYIISGGANGADTMAIQWAHKNKVTYSIHYADWERYKNSAGIIRNKQMLDQEEPDLVVAFPGGTGTAHMVKISKEAGIDVREIC